MNNNIRSAVDIFLKKCSECVYYRMLQGTIYCENFNGQAACLTVSFVVARAIKTKKVKLNSWADLDLDAGIKHVAVSRIQKGCEAFEKKGGI